MTIKALNSSVLRRGIAQAIAVHGTTSCNVCLFLTQNLPSQASSSTSEHDVLDKPEIACCRAGALQADCAPPEAIVTSASLAMEGATEIKLTSLAMPPHTV